MAFLDCFRPKDQAQAHINVKIGCCNKKVSRTLKRSETDKILKMFEMTEEKFNKLLQAIEHIEKHSESEKL